MQALDGATKLENLGAKQWPVLSRFSFATAAEKQLKQRKHCKKHCFLVASLEKWCLEKGIAEEIENYELT